MATSRGVEITPADRPARRSASSKRSTCVRERKAAMPKDGFMRVPSQGLPAGATSYTASYAAEQTAVRRRREAQ